MSLVLTVFIRAFALQDRRQNPFGRGTISDTRDLVPRSGQSEINVKFAGIAGANRTFITV